MPGFAIPVQIDVPKGICKSEATLRIKFRFLQQCCLFCNRIPDIVFWKISVIEWICFNRFGRNIWDTCMESGKILKRLSVLVQVIRGQEENIWSSQRPMTILVCSIIWTVEEKQIFAFLTQDFNPMCPEASLYILLFVPRNLKFYCRQSYV